MLRRCRVKVGSLHAVALQHVLQRHDALECAAKRSIGYGQNGPPLKVREHTEERLIGKDERSALVAQSILQCALRLGG